MNWFWGNVGSKCHIHLSTLFCPISSSYFSFSTIWSWEGTLLHSIYLFMVAVLGLPCCACIFTSCGKQGALYVEVLGFSLWGLPLLQNSGSRCTSFNSCMGLVVPWHVGSSQTRDGTLTCIGRLILNHWTTGEVPYIFVWRTGKHQIWKACDLWRGKNLSS